MSYLSESHNQWHAIYGALAVCPLDCGAGEEDYQPEAKRPAGYRQSAVGAWLDSLDAQEAASAESVFRIVAAPEPPF
jgi:hypothetical protein